MHKLLEEWLDYWVWPTAPGMPGATYRHKLTEEKCLPVWEFNLEQALRRTELALDSGDEEWIRQGAIHGYSGEGIQVSIKQMSAQLLPIKIDEQDQFLNLQRMRSRQVWDECKHSKLHAEVLLAKGWIQSERDLMHMPEANTNFMSSFFGQGMMFQHVHPLARAAQNYFQEANACMGILAVLSLVDDPVVRHENLSQRYEEIYHFMEGKYQLDAYCGTPEHQQVVDERMDWLRNQMWAIVP